MAIETLAPGLILGFIFLIIAIIALAIFMFVFWILMIIDCAKRKFKSDSEKVIWILLLIFLSWIATIIYYFAVKAPNRR